MLKSAAITSVGSVVSLTDSTQIGRNITKAQGIIPRPLSAFKGPPRLPKLWQFGAEEEIFDTLSTLVKPGGGTLTSADKVAAIRIYQQGKSLLYFYDMTNRKLRGLFYMGDDESFTGDLTLETGVNSGLPYFEVLGSGYDSNAKWYGPKMYGQLMLQNGVDTPIAAQLGRTANPGKLRKRGTNERPAPAVLSLIAPQTSANVQASRTVSGLKMTASDTNFAGASGNSKISVSVNLAYSGAIFSTISGTGELSNPYIYVVTAPTTATNAEVATFINADTNAIPILTASVTTPGTIAAWIPDYLSGGSGTGTSIGLTAESVTVYLKYWDPGFNSCGYEGPASDISNQVVISAASNKDVQVLIAINESAEGGRFSGPGCGIRIYKQYGEDAPIWNLMNEDAPVSNSARTQDMVADSPNDRLWSYNLTGSVTGDSVLDTWSGLSLSNGNKVVFATAGSGISAFVEYFVVNASGSTFQISSTLGGSPIDLASNSTLTVYRLVAHQFTPDDIVRVSVTAPSGITIGANYYIMSGGNLGTYYVRLSATKNGGVVNFTTSPSGVRLSAHYVIFNIGSTLEPGRLMTIDQNRPPACKYASLAGGSVWLAGIAGANERLLSSREQTFDEVCPEGVSLDDYDTIAKSEGTGNSGITGMYSDKQYLHLHYHDGIVIINPQDTSAQHEPQIQAGAANGQCIMDGKSNKILFLSIDRNIYQFSGARYGARAGDSITNDAIAYVSSWVSTNDMQQNPDKCTIMHDQKSQLVFYWMPDSNGNQIGFCYDETTGGTYGPYYAPFTPVAVCDMEMGLGIHVLGDENGNLFVWDPENQGDTDNSFGSQANIQIHDEEEDPGIDHEGYLTKDVEIAGNIGVLWYANESVLETGMIDLGDPGSLKKFRGVQWRSVHFSRGYIEVSLIGHNGRTVSVNYGEMGNKERAKPHRVLMNLNDTACKIRIKVIGADLLHWIIRDLELLYE